MAGRWSQALATLREPVARRVIAELLVKRVSALPLDQVETDLATLISRGNRMRIDLMDMGQKKYGDCILVTRKDRVILIDGAHNHDSNDLSSQLGAVLGHGAPFHADLLIVTHCHDDHIGQLPELVADGSLTADVVLAADEKLGWGIPSDGSDAFSGLPSRERGLVSALLEEDRSDLPADELEEFIQDSAKLIDRYSEMLDALRKAGATVVRYGRDADAKVRRIEQDFADFGLEVLGPTQEHLLKCAEVLHGQADALARDFARADAADADAAAIYRRLTRGMAQDAMGAEDRPGPGAAKNDQSIIVKVTADGWSALLAGDMQFAKAEVPGLTPIMKALRTRVAAAGPYDFVKLTHHTSYNGLDETVLADFPGTKLYAHTGGRQDADHPDPGALDVLKSKRQELDLTFARTDRNGRITVKKEGSAVVMLKEKGRFNDFTPNEVGDESVRRGETAAPTPPSAESRTRIAQSSRSDVVEVITRVPHTSTRVTVRIDVEPQTGGTTGSRGPSDRTEKPKPPPDPEANAPADRAMRPQPDLLFVTRQSALEPAIGRLETRQVLAMISGSGATLIDLGDKVGTAEDAAKAVRAKLQERAYKGVVVVGGFDVVPAQRVDVLDAALRREIADAGHEGDDADDFVVWSDEIYGDRDGDFMPELPVSRIPDARRSDVVINALAAPSFSSQRRFGVRNVNRPFAEQVFPAVPGGKAGLEVSEKFGPNAVTPGSPAGAVYFMLHGSARDATRFWGERSGGTATEAFAVENVPSRAPGTVVFSGCCWGALAMSPPAAQVRQGAPLRVRGPEASIAVAYLLAGAQAFIGCTGSHYSPLRAPYDYFGRPMHDAFWQMIVGGHAPAEALYRAKAEFARGMPHGQRDAFSRGVELKLLREFTCLGIGW